MQQTWIMLLQLFSRVQRLAHDTIKTFCLPVCLWETGEIQQQRQRVHLSSRPLSQYPSDHYH